jgi:hypothetical protein
VIILATPKEREENLTATLSSLASVEARLQGIRYQILEGSPELVIPELDKAIARINMVQEDLSQGGI